ncbi:MAG TPA: DUF417 family protein [Geminicoccus sp.]|uniref:DUF417 family protein n=1 Tax=Geminicoccus sp. TaxID=2024832 RepID=UPI002E375D79|nr:DUF417 family protein [Geminicoccus sp.]HEX2526039.1 DUF417 family protein [Geminicoccus sp.]
MPEQHDRRCGQAWLGRLILCAASTVSAEARTRAPMTFSIFFLFTTKKYAPRIDVECLHIYASCIQMRETIMQHLSTTTGQLAGLLDRFAPAGPIKSAGRAVALAGVILPLAMIGILKFTQIEIDALKPLISGTPWLAWLYLVFGEAGAAYLLGSVELLTAALLVASPWSVRAGAAGGALASLTFAVTVSTMFALPIWESGSGGFPWLNATGSFLIKDVALLGTSLVVLGESLARLSGTSIQGQR